MTLSFCRDLSAADWIVHSGVPWQQLVGFGPAGFDAYARLRILPDPVQPGQSENDADADDGRMDQLPALFDVLATCTSTPDDCYFCVWEGFGQVDRAVHEGAVHLDRSALTALPQPGEQPGWAPHPALAPSSMPDVPKVVLPHRAYWLFRGPLTDVGRWDAAAAWPARCRLEGAEPAFVWPAGHQWCVARDVDPHWAGIGGTAPLITRLVTDPRLDVVPAEPTQDQLRYR